MMFEYAVTQIRGTSEFVYRSGEWAQIKSIETRPGVGRIVNVEWEDGDVDSIYLDSKGAGWEFR